MEGISVYKIMAEAFDGKQFDTHADFERAVEEFCSDFEEELGKAERWACQNDEFVLEQLGVEILEKEEE